MIDPQALLCRAAASLLAILVSCSALAANDLYVSEYVEGSGDNKALEIYGATSAHVTDAEHDIVHVNIEFLVQAAGAGPGAPGNDCE